MNPKIKQIIANFETAGVGKFRVALQELTEAHRNGEITFNEYMTGRETILAAGLENSD